MGHLHHPRLPRTREWDEVVGLIQSNADVSAIASASLNAAEINLRTAADDVGFAQATWLITQLPLAARSSNYPGRLAELGLVLDHPPHTGELAAALSRTLDAHMARTRSRSDIGEMARMAATEVLTATLTRGTSTLFGTTPDEVRRELASLATPTRFGSFARDFFGGLIRRYLGFYLSRELSNHVGGARRFQSLEAHAEFTKALALHCAQSATIVQKFAGEWFSRHTFHGGITTEKARRFGYVALKKLRAELLRSGRTE